MALHVLAVLAYHEGDRVTSTLLAASVNTHPVIIRRLLLALQRARLGETCKGAGVGSRLSRSPRRINLAQVYRAVEQAELFPPPRQKPSGACPVGQCIRGAQNTVFASARNALDRELEKTSLADVVRAVKTPPRRAANKTG